MMSGLELCSAHQRHNRFGQLRFRNDLSSSAQQASLTHPKFSGLWGYVCIFNPIQTPLHFSVRDMGVILDFAEHIEALTSSCYYHICVSNESCLALFLHLLLPPWFMPLLLIDWITVRFTFGFHKFVCVV